MEPNLTKITHDFPPLFRVHNTSHVERYHERGFISPLHDHKIGVVSRDVVVSPKKNVLVRIFLPEITEADRKLPLIIYIYGGVFSLESAFSSMYHNYTNSLASESRSVIVSVEYRLAPEHPIPACFDDSYAVLVGDNL